MSRRRRSGAADLWVVNFREEPRIIACRAPKEENVVGQNLFSLLSEAEQKRISVAMMSYDMTPLVSETVEGRALIFLPSLMPSSTLCVVLASPIPRKILLRFLKKRSGMRFDWNEAMMSEASGRMPGNVVKHEVELNTLMEEIHWLDFSALSPDESENTLPFDRFLKERMTQIAQLTGCALAWEETGEMTDAEHFDFGVTTSFLLLSMLLGAMTASSHCVTAGFARGEVRIRFSCREIPEGFSWELESIEAIAEAKQMYFMRSYSDGQLCLVLRPKILELSYLGIKAPQPLLCEEEFKESKEWN